MAKRYQRGNQNQKIDEEQTIGIFWPLYCVFFVDWPILIATLVSFGHCIVCSSSIYLFCLPLWYLLAIVLSVLRRFTDSDYPFGIFWPWHCVFFVDNDEEQTIQWPNDTKGVIRISKTTENRQYNGQKIPKGQSESVNRRRTDNTMTKRYQRGNQNQ
jgi:hypothetical protein